MVPAVPTARYEEPRMPELGPDVEPEIVTPAMRLASAVPARVRAPVIEAGEIAQFTASTLRSAITRPKGYWLATRDEMYDLLRFGFVPCFATVGIFTFVVCSVAYSLMSVLGTPERMGQYVLLMGLRETVPFITGMVVAGIMGTAVTADLGARKIREELDALYVLGLDPMRLLVIPRVIGLAVMQVLLSIVAIAATIACAYLVGVVIGEVAPGIFWDNLLRNMTPAELIGMLVKVMLMGMLIASVHCYKGVRVGGGAQDVGRAVNQAVVIAFLGMFILDVLFNAIMYALFPELQTIR
jgi:phospholipid/cholesterol/gamma-HCH transport system permease protein